MKSCHTFGHEILPLPHSKRQVTRIAIRPHPSIWPVFQRCPVLTRREFNTGVSVVAIAAIAGLPNLAFAQRADVVPPADLAVPMPLGDMTMGKDDAPVTIIEYASMTCPHCAHFTVETFPKLKEKYIDTGKVKYIFREF